MFTALPATALPVWPDRLAHASTTVHGQSG